MFLLFTSTSICVVGVAENYQAEEESGGGSSTSAVRDEAGHGSSSDEGGAGVSQS